MEIKVKSLVFGSSGFRKLGGISINFADRLTLIAGHNGIGKSTILGLVSNTFGLTEKSGQKNYFGEPFYTNIERIVYLDLAEVAGAQVDPTSAPVVTAIVDDIEIKKRCAMTQRTEWKRARVVPRTIDPVEGDSVGPDAKVPLPTIYLGMKRLASVGEASEDDVVSAKPKMHANDSELMVKFIRAVIHGSQLNSNFTSQTIKGSKKKTIQPGYEQHNSLAVSIGQDSLSSIATALASFNKLKRDLGKDYPGGLLIIDEMDAGLHPHAIERLVKALKTQAKSLSLQIIATTHSPRLIEVVHPDGGGDARAPDGVIYLLDTKKPRLAPDQSLRAILRDMAQSPEDAEAINKKPVLSVYFEDEQAVQFCAGLIPLGVKNKLASQCGVSIKLISLGIGGSNLVSLPTKDRIFLDKVLIVDADTKVSNTSAAQGNIVKLPCTPKARGVARSIENTIKQFLRDISDASDGPLHQALLDLNVTNPSTDKIHRTFFEDGQGDSTEREAAKAWWKTNAATIKKWRVIEQWAIVYKKEADEFKRVFELAIVKTAARLKKK